MPQGAGAPPWFWVSTFCYYKDAVDIILKLAVSKKTTKKIFNVGSQRPEIKIKNLITIIMKVLKMKKKVIFIKDKHNSPSRRCPNMRSANQIVGKLKFTKIEDGIKKTFEHYINKWSKN